MPGRAVPKGTQAWRSTPVRRSNKSDNPEIVLVQRDVDAAFRGALKDTPFKNGNLLSISFSLLALDKTVPHKLGGRATGFIVVNNNAFTHLRQDVPSDSALRDSHIRLVASSACEVKVWVWRL